MRRIDADEDVDDGVEMVLLFYRRAQAGGTQRHQPRAVQARHWLLGCLWRVALPYRLAQDTLTAREPTTSPYFNPFCNHLTARP